MTMRSRKLTMTISECVCVCFSSGYLFHWLLPIISAPSEWGLSPELVFKPASSRSSRSSSSSWNSLYPPPSHLWKRDPTVALEGSPSVSSLSVWRASGISQPTSQQRHAGAERRDQRGHPQVVELLWLACLGVLPAGVHAELLQQEGARVAGDRAAEVERARQQADYRVDSRPSGTSWASITVMGIQLSCEIACWVALEATMNRGSGMDTSKFHRRYTMALTHWTTLWVRLPITSTDRYLHCFRNQL
ncbi:unnamed protein product [Prorocentrum cordatum]|uniref:Uncharacterized protein n=1 Tax=Prorocentrum cordatum TaxID=2364126 RepID=A0ABN9RZS6_9DINO|nr:unnamed protein product [Polarella glacialis]